MANQKITYLDTDLKSFRTVGDLLFFYNHSAENW